MLSSSRQDGLFCVDRPACSALLFTSFLQTNFIMLLFFAFYLSSIVCFTNTAHNNTTRAAAVNSDFDLSHETWKLRHRAQEMSVLSRPRFGSD